MAEETKRAVSEHQAPKGDHSTETWIKYDHVNKKFQARTSVYRAETEEDVEIPKTYCVVDVSLANLSIELLMEEAAKSILLGPVRKKLKDNLEADPSKVLQAFDLTESDFITERAVTSRKKKEDHELAGMMNLVKAMKLELTVEQIEEVANADDPAAMLVILTTKV